MYDSTTEAESKAISAWTFLCSHSDLAASAANAKIDDQDDRLAETMQSSRQIEQ